MSDEAFTTITFRLPSEMRDKIKERATEEERSEAGFIRYHLAIVLGGDQSEQTSEEAPQ